MTEISSPQAGRAGRFSRRRARGDVRQGRDRCRGRRRTSSSRIERHPVRPVSGGSSDAFRSALSAPLRVLQQSSDEGGKGEPFWYERRRRRLIHPLARPPGLSMASTAMLVAWARARLTIFSTIRVIVLQTASSSRYRTCRTNARPPCCGKPWRYPDRAVTRPRIEWRCGHDRRDPRPRRPEPPHRHRLCRCRLPAGARPDPNDPARTVGKFIPSFSLRSRGG